MRKAVMLSADVGGCCMYRNWIPLGYLSDEGLLEGHITNVALDYELFGGEKKLAHAFGFQRPTEPQWLQYIARWRPITWIDIDDNFFDLHKGNPCYHDMKHFRRMNNYDPQEIHKRALHMAEVVTTTTHQLAERVAACCDRNQNIAVIPNAIYNPISEHEIDLQLIRAMNRPLRIGWWGGHHHQEDWIGLDGKFAKLIDKYQGKVQFVFIGWAPRAVLEGGKIEMESWVPPQYWYEGLHAMDLDICLGPLVKNDFSVCKSNIKWLETGMFKRCFVCYDHPVFEDVEHGVTGIKVNGPDAMLDAVEELIADPAKAKDIGRNAYKHVQENYHISQMRDKWMRVFNHLFQRADEHKFVLSLDELADYEEMKQGNPIDEIMSAINVVTSLKNKASFKTQFVPRFKQ